MKKHPFSTKAGVLMACLMALGLPVQAQSLTDVVQSALVIYPSLQSAQAKTQAQRADIDRARAAHYPQLAYGYTRSEYANATMPQTLKANTNSPSVRLNLWSGGRIEADARHAEALTLGAEFLEASTRDDVALAAAEAYINWARALDMHALASKNVASHRATLDDIQKIVNVDTGRRIDLEQAQVRMDNASLALLQRETELQQARQRLGRFWQGPMPDKPTGLLTNGDTNHRMAYVPNSIEQVLDLVSDDLPSIAQQKAQVTAAREAVSMARGQYWPTVDLSATRQLSPFTTGRDLLGNPITTYKEDTFTQVQVNMPLYSGGATSAAIDAALAQLKAAQYALDEARLLARERVTFAFQDWANAKGRAAQGAEQARVGDKVVEGYRLQFRLARRQLLDLLNIQNESFNYQSAATNAHYDEHITRARLLAAMGELANRFSDRTP